MNLVATFDRIANRVDGMKRIPIHPLLLLFLILQLVYSIWRVYQIDVQVNELATIARDCIGHLEGLGK